MARILMAGAPAYGLAMPSLPFVRALVDAGHEVDYVMGEAFRDRVEAAGATLVPFGPREAITRPAQLALQGRRLFRALNASIRRLARHYDAVVAGGLNPEIPDLQRELDRPVINLSPVFFQNDRVIAHLARISTTLPGPARRLMASPTARRRLTAVLGPLVFGSRPPDILNLLRPMSSTLNISPATRHYQPFAGTSTTSRATSPARRPPRPRLTPRSRSTGSGPTTAPSSTPRSARSSTATSTTSGPSSRRSPTATHGVFGSTTDTVLAGVPAVFTPMGADQFFNAHRMEELGAGRVLGRADVTPSGVRRVADALLSGARPAGLATLKESFEQAPGPAGAVREIERVLA